MGTLVLKLDGPLQSWGVESRFTKRKTADAPTKSGVVGLVASALGRRRIDDISDLAAFPMVARIDQPGAIIKDFQTVVKSIYDKRLGTWRLSDKNKDMLPLSNRYYLADALFMVGLEVPNNRLDELADALEHPIFSLYLGRRACPPATKVLYGVYPDADALRVLADIPWQASATFARRHAFRNGFAFDAEGRTVTLTVLREDADGAPVRDIPLSFSPEHRTYEVRSVVYDSVVVENPHAPRVLLPKHDPLEALVEVGA